MSAVHAKTCHLIRATQPASELCVGGQAPTVAFNFVVEEPSGNDLAPGALRFDPAPDRYSQAYQSAAVSLLTACAPDTGHEAALRRIACAANASSVGPCDALDSCSSPAAINGTLVGSGRIHTAAGEFAFSLVAPAKTTGSSTVECFAGHLGRMSAAFADEVDALASASTTATASAATRANMFRHASGSKEASSTKASESAHKSSSHTSSHAPSGASVSISGSRSAEASTSTSTSEGGQSSGSSSAVAVTSTTMSPPTSIVVGRARANAQRQAVRRLVAASLLASALGLAAINA